MSPNTKTTVIVATATATQTLPENAVQVQSAVAPPAANTTSGAITSTTLTPTTGTPSAGQIQFTGSPHAPSNTVTLNSALTAGQLLIVTYVPVGALGAAA